MIIDWLTNPVALLAPLLVLCVGLFKLAGRVQAKGTYSKGKREPYACGVDPALSESAISYHRFFRLALVFVVAHMAALVIAMLPREADVQLLATGYLIGAALCVDMLISRGPGE